MNILYRIDNYLFDARYGFQWLSDTLQEKTGFNCYFWAQVSAILSASSLLASSILSSGQVDLFTIIMAFITMSFPIVDKFFVNQAVNRVIYQTLRVLILSISTFSFFMLSIVFLSAPSFFLFLLFWVLFFDVCMIYFISCIPKPPKKNRKKARAGKAVAATGTA